MLHVYHKWCKRYKQHFHQTCSIFTHKMLHLRCEYSARPPNNVQKTQATFSPLIQNFLPKKCCVWILKILQVYLKCYKKNKQHFHQTCSIFTHKMLHLRCEDATGPLNMAQEKQDTFFSLTQHIHGDMIAACAQKGLGLGPEVWPQLRRRPTKYSSTNTHRNFFWYVYMRPITFSIEMKWKYIYD